MAFLDNSGDIILDAVLTDTGRARLAKGDGTFKIVKFALADDEIDYELYNHSHESGSAYYDLDVLMTPVLEAFTNNASSMKSKLISIPRTNLLYLPVLKINDKFVGNEEHDSGGFLVAVDKETQTDIGTTAANIKGVLYGEDVKDGKTTIRLDQGLDTDAISADFSIDADLKETQYIVEIDNRLGSIASEKGSNAQVSYIDDDNIASYYFSATTDAEYVESNGVTTAAAGNAFQTIAGPRGTILKFRIKSSIELNTSEYLFDLLGSLSTSAVGDITASNSILIDSIVRVTGATTGSSVDIPVRFVKKV